VSHGICASENPPHRRDEYHLVARSEQWLEPVAAKPPFTAARPPGAEGAVGIVEHSATIIICCFCIHGNISAKKLI
jgi:hypothetical protein